MVALFVALMFIGFVLADMLVRKLEARPAAALNLAVNLAAPYQMASKSLGPLDAWPAIPEGVYLAKGHTWLSPQAEGVFLAGADALVSRALGAVSKVILPRVEQEVWTGSPLFQLDLGGRILTVPSPVTGRVVSVNRQLRDRPELVAQAPYGAGWVCELLPTRLEQEKTMLRVGDKARAWLEREMDRLAEFLGALVPADPALGATSLDGGAVVPGALTGFDAEIWRAFEHKFLSRK